MYNITPGITFQWAIKTDAYIYLDFFIEVQLIVDHIVCAVFAAVAKTKHHEPNLKWQLAVISSETF